ncbi:MAG TPA: condensation domain-containing protein, partial [Longimicrobiaceae bacterium]
RIEPGEVAAALRRHPGVREAVVVAREDEPGERRLVAYVAGGADAEALRAQLKRTLPEYMIPAAFVRMDALPLTPNGKLDRRALPAPELASAARYVAPRTAVEKVLAAIWAAVLGVERVGVRDRFFDLGGHSLLATRMLSRVREVFGVEPTVRAVFEGPTVAELARTIEGMRNVKRARAMEIVRVPRTGALPLSFAQERLWFLDRLEPGSAFYNYAPRLRLRGALDAAALGRALGEIARRHEALRTVFREQGTGDRGQPAGAPVQVILPAAAFAMRVEDVSAHADAEREAMRRADEESERAFDLAAGLLFRPLLLRIAADDHVLVLAMHHVVSDEWSMGVLCRELAALYAAFVDGRESPLPELAVQYADYAVWQREHLRGEALERDLAWWRERLAGAPALLELPTDHPRPKVQTHRGGQEHFDLPPALLERLQALGRREGATLYMVVLAAFQALLARYANTGDVVVGSPIAGRTRREVEELIGFFVNTLVLRTDLSGDPGFREVVRRVRETTLGAYQHQEVPFERLVAELQPERALSHQPLFQVMFIQAEPDPFEAALPGVRVEHLAAGRETGKFDLVLTVAASGHGVLEFATDLYERATARRMIGHLQRVLEQVAADADARLSALDLAGEAERRLVLEEWNATEMEISPIPVHRLFEAQAARTPEATALRFNGSALTYRELDERANRLARHLAGLGVRPEVRVGICLERSLEMVVAVLAVL